MNSNTTTAPAGEAPAAFRSAPFSHDPVPQVASEHRHATIDFSKALGVRTITIQSHHVQVLFEHHFERIDHALFIATKAVRNQGRIKDARLAEDKIHQLLDDYSKALSENLATLQKQLETNVPKEFQTLLYDHKREFAAPIRTGYSQRFLALTAQLDQLIGLIENLELNNVLTPENSDKSIKSWLRYYRQLCSAIQQVRKTAVSRKDEKPETAAAPASEVSAPSDKKPTVNAESVSSDSIS